MPESLAYRKYANNIRDLEGTSLIGVPDLCFYPKADVAYTVPVEGNLHIYYAIGNGTLPVEIYTRTADINGKKQQLIDVVYGKGLDLAAREDVKHKSETLASYIKQDPGFKLFELVLLQQNKKVSSEELRAIFGESRIVEVHETNGLLVNGVFLEAIDCLYKRAVARYKDENEPIQLPLVYSSEPNWI